MTPNIHEPVVPGVCDFCDEPIPGHLTRARFCCQEHQQQARNLRRRGTRPNRRRGDRPCVVCGKMMIDAAASRKYCDDLCSKRAYVKAERERRQAKREAKAQPVELVADGYALIGVDPGAYLGTFVKRGVTCRTCQAKNVHTDGNCAACANNEKAVHVTGLCDACAHVDAMGRAEEAARAKDRYGRYDVVNAAAWRNRPAMARARNG